MIRKSKRTTVSISVKILFWVPVIVLIHACGGDLIEASSNPKENLAEEKSSTNSTEAPAKGLTDESAPDFLKAFARKHNENEILITTNFGDIRIRLYQNTPMHRGNFIYLAKQGYFDGTWFYRVSPGHVIQAGNNDESETGKKRSRIGDYKVPNEIGTGNLHKRGAVAAARTYYQNPGKHSNPYEFYIVLGKSYSPRELELLAEKEGFDLTEKQKQVYARFPGSPHLDEEHTVFGEVTEGLDVVEAISKVQIDNGEWPLENIPIRVKVME